MARPKIAIAGFQHETNTFAPLPTTYDIFEKGGAWPALQRGEAVIDGLTGLNLPMGGFLAEAGDFDLLPILWTFAEPGGYVSDDAFDRIAGMIVDAIAGAHHLDGVYLDLHGAMVTQSHDDGEAELLRRIRAVVGPDLPISVSLDLHGNLSPAFAELASSVTIYRTYPHIDMAATGARACHLLREELARGQPFARAWRQLDFLIPLQAQSTRRQPGAQLYGMLPDLEKGAVRSVDFVFGFPPADIPHCGCSVFAYGTEQAAVDAAADAMLGELQAAEDDLQNPLVQADEAVAKAKTLAATASRPVIIADAQDNPGAGATGETTGLLAALVRGGAERAVISMLWDPDMAAKAHAAGLHATFEAAIGGRFSEFSPGPYKATVRVVALSDGRFTFTGPMFGGAEANLGLMAALHIEEANSDVTVIVGSNRTQTADQAILSHLGIDPAAQAIVVVKSTVHFMADFEPIAADVIFAESPGANPCQLDRIPYARLRDGLRLGPHGPAFGRGA
ncbi:MAG: M81 family metallopeptidase [Alphaproteobacteria bacterium]